MMPQSLYWLGQRLLCSGTNRASANGCPEPVNSQEPPSLLPMSWKDLWVLCWQEKHTEVRSGQGWSKRPKESGQSTESLLHPCDSGGLEILQVLLVCLHSQAPLKCFVSPSPAVHLSSSCSCSFSTKFTFSSKHFPAPSHVEVLSIFSPLWCTPILGLLLHIILNTYDLYWLVLFAKLWVHEGQGWQLIHVCKLQYLSESGWCSMHTYWVHLANELKSTSGKSSDFSTVGRWENLIPLFFKCTCTLPF